MNSLPGQRSMFPCQRYAEFSACRQYRYSLWRVWGHTGRLVNWIMVNPSVADEINDDPTIRRCLGFTDSWGYDGLIVTNLFGIRETNPRMIVTHVNPVGVDNDQYILKYASECSLIICAWGNNGSFRDRDLDVTRLLTDQKHELYCLTVTNDSQPGHPLRLKNSLTPIPWKPAHD